MLPIVMRVQVLGAPNRTSDKFRHLKSFFGIGQDFGLSRYGEAYLSGLTSSFFRSKSSG